MTAAKNIGLPDSLLSRFDLVFIVLDEHNSHMDRLVADRVIKNHMMTDHSPILNFYDDKIIEPDLNTEDVIDAPVFLKTNEFSNGKKKNDVLTKQFLRKYLHYCKRVNEPNLNNDAVDFLARSWTELRGTEEETAEKKSGKAVTITVRTLESLIRIASAHAKMRLSKNITKKDCEVAYELLKYALSNDFNKDDKEEVEEEANNADVEMKSVSRAKSSKKGKTRS